MPKGFIDMTKTFLLAGAAIVALSTAASAATFTLSGGVAGDIPGSGGASNQVLMNTFGFAPGASLSGGFFGSQITLDTDATVTASFFGLEAGFTNSFVGGGSTLFSATGNFSAPDGNTPLATGTFAGNSIGFLDFAFESTNGSNTISAVNGSNPGVSADQPNFYAWIDDNGSTSGDTIWLFYDDGGAGPDDNHDDFVVSLSVAPPGGGGTPPSPVPLPAGGMLLIGGLGALAVARRRKDKS